MVIVFFFRTKCMGFYSYCPKYSETLFLDPWFYNEVISKPIEATKTSIMSRNYFNLKTVFES